MRNSLIRTGILLFVTLFIVGCNSDADTERNSTSTESKEVQETATKDNTSVDYEEYPLPILSGWEEEETSFKSIGNGTIDLWKGQFTFEEDIDAYFEPYQEALKDLGYEVTVEDDLEGRKSVKFKQILDGDLYEGSATFSQSLITTGVQRFK